MTGKTVYINHDNDGSVSWLLLVLFLIFVAFMVFLFNLNDPLRVSPVQHGIDVGEKTASKSAY